MDPDGPSLRSFGVFLSGLMMAFIFNGSFISNGVLFPETISELQTSNFEAGSAYALQAAAAFTIAGFGGAALEGVSYRILGVTGGFLFGVGLISYGLLGSGLWTLFTFIGITAAGGGLLHFATLMTYLEHFDEKFSVAYSVKELSAFLGISAMPPLMELFRVKYGFHGSFLILGAVSWNCIVCGVLLKPAKRSHQREYTFGNEVLTSLRKGCLQSSYSYYKTKLIHKLSRMSSHSPALRHPNFAIFLVIHSVFYYSFTGWALFVVPFAVSLGHSSQRAVYLSTAGGIGGLAGKLLALIIFYFNKMNPITGGLLPSLGLCIGLLGYIFSEDYLFLMSSSFLCGFAIAYADSALCGMMPQYLCQYHLRQGCCISYLYGGLFMQFGGSACGAILDFTFSYTWLFGTMVILQVSIGILAAILYLRDSKVEECGADTKDSHDY